jgi:hypothetical protein
MNGFSRALRQAQNELINEVCSYYYLQSRAHENAHVHEKIQVNHVRIQ